MKNDSNNTSLNKFLGWHIDGATIEKSIWFLGNTNSCFSDATFVIFKTMEKS